MKKLKIIIISLLIILIVFLSGAFFFVQNALKVHDVDSSTIINIDSSMNPRDIFNELAKLEVIDNGDVAYYYSRLLHPYDFKAGAYNIPQDTDINGLIDYLSNADNAIKNTVMITFIEGDWLKDFALKLQENTNLNADELMAYWDDEETVRSLMEDYPFLTEDIFNDGVRHPLEGYFFPDTYEFYIETTMEDVTRRLLDQSLVIYEKYKDDFAESSLTIHEIYTLASIVQYEASSFEDMKDVAGVFYNRLNDGMRLQSSVTVCYAIDIEPDEDWTACETNSDFDDPYNTYMYDGLPPGPILNPGEDALLAVLEPNDNDYYYFIGDVCGDGAVHFAQTLDEHNANIEEYLWCY